MEEAIVRYANPPLIFMQPMGARTRFSRWKSASRIGGGGRMGFMCIGFALESCDECPHAGLVGILLTALLSRG